jgi:hypothetical protein
MPLLALESWVVWIGCKAEDAATLTHPRQVGKGKVQSGVN